MPREDDVIIEDYKEEEVRQIEQEKEFKRLLRDYQLTFSSVHGARVLRDILEQCRVFHLSFTGNANTYLFEGKRSIGLYIMTMLDKLSMEGLVELREQFIKAKKGV